MESTAAVGTAAGLAVAALGPITHQWSFIVAGAIIGSVVALGEAETMPVRKSITFIARCVVLSSMFSGLAAAALIRVIGSQIIDGFLTPQMLLSVVAAGLAWMLGDWKLTLKSILALKG